MNFERCTQASDSISVLSSASAGLNWLLMFVQNLMTHVTPAGSDSLPKCSFDAPECLVFSVFEFHHKYLGGWGQVTAEDFRYFLKSFEVRLGS